MHSSNDRCSSACALWRRSSASRRCSSLPGLRADVPVRLVPVLLVLWTSTEPIGSFSAPQAATLSYNYLPMAATTQAPAQTSLVTAVPGAALTNGLR